MLSFKKLLGIISIIIVVVFSLMLTTSYAWYSFENARTSVSGVTNNDDIINCSDTSITNKNIQYE